MVEGGRGGADKIFKPDREALCVPELHSSSSLLLAVGRLPASVLAGRPGRSGIRPRRRASACTSGDIEHASTMIPVPTKNLIRTVRVADRAGLEPATHVLREHLGRANPA